ncbi:MAG: leucyl aminopeptidase, partial [Myxococcota bacterium]
DVDDDTLTTIALDLHNSTRGNLTVKGNDPVAAIVAKYGAAEDGYRRWINEDPAIRTSVAIANDVESFAAAHDGVDIEILAEPELEKHGLNLLLAVGGASIDSPPRLVIATWTPKANPDAPRTMLLGKGITFDTGGINVKPYVSHVSQMKNDMGGAALAWWLFRTLVESNYNEPLMVVIPTCENAIGEKAMRPGALIKSHRGKVVRVDHTDAEGRLALADGLSYAGDKYAPARVISFATLTTSALTSYGPYATPIHFATPSQQSSFEEASEQMGEDLHFFPYRRWHFEANRDQEADLRNTARLPGSASRAAGSRNAAHFLKHFTDLQITHFDIFASTWNWAGDAPGCGYGATGTPLRTLLRAFNVAG